MCKTVYFVHIRTYNTSRGSRSIVLIEAGSLIQAGSPSPTISVWQIAYVVCHLYLKDMRALRNTHHTEVGVFNPLITLEIYTVQSCLPCQRYQGYQHSLYSAQSSLPDPQYEPTRQPIPTQAGVFEPSQT